MLKIDLDHPRSHGFTDEQLAPWREDWPAWPVAPRPRRFDRDEAITLAVASRYGTWLHVTHYDQLLAQRDGHLGAQELAFWASLATSPEYVLGELPDAARDPESKDHPNRAWVESLADGVPVGVDAETLIARCRPVFDAIDSATMNARDTQHLLGRVMRAYVPWDRAFEIARDQFDLAGLCAFVQGLGPAPRADSARASALVREVYEGIDLATLNSFELTYGPVQLLLVAPIQDLIVRYFESWKALHPKHETIQYEPSHDLVYHLTDPKSFTRVFKSLDFRVYTQDVEALFGRFGYACVEPLMRYGLKPRKDRPIISTLRRALEIAAPEVIAQLQPLADKGGEWAAEVRGHLDAAPPEHAAHGLIACCNRAGKKRTWAVEELRLLAAREGGAEAITSALSQWKEVTAEFVRAEVLDHEEQHVLELDAADAPGWVRELSARASQHDPPIWWGEEPPRLAFGDDALALPAECSWGLAAACAADLDLTGLTGLDPDSAARLARVAFEWWHESSITNSDTWPIGFVAAFPNDASVAALERLVREKKPPFRGALSDKVKLAAIASLGLIDLPSARRGTLWLLSHHAKDAFRAAARGARDAYCEANDLTHDEYADRAVSDFGLDARRGRDFDYGPRTIRMKVSGRELSFVDSSSEKVSPRLPRGTRKDDTDRVKRARAEFGVIGKPLREELDRQRMRFEHGMLTARHWKAPAWQEDVLAPPLLGAIAGGLVWAIWSGERRVGLARPDEEGQLIDVDFDEVTLGHDATLSLPHPLDLTREERDAWQDHLLSFEIVQPFDQMGRALYTPDDASRAFLAALHAKEFELDVLAIEALSAHGLAKIDWAMSAPQFGYAHAMHVVVVARDAPDSADDVLAIECPYNAAFSSSRRRYSKVTTSPYIGMEYAARRTLPRGDEDPASALELDEIPPKLFSEAMILLHACAVARSA